MEADLGLQVVVVDDGRLHRVEVPAPQVGDQAVALAEQDLVEERGIESDLLAQPEQHVLARRALEPVEGLHEGGPGTQQPLLGHDGQAEVDRQDDDPQWLVVLGHEVLERGQDTVAGTPLMRRRSPAGR